MTIDEALEAAAQIAEREPMALTFDPRVAAPKDRIAKKIRALMGKPFRLMEAEANIPLPRRLETETIEKAAARLMESRSWHLEAFACAFFRETGSREGSKYRLVERRETEGTVVRTIWQFEKIRTEPPEETDEELIPPGDML